MHILPTDQPGSFETAISRAAELLTAGQVVALPTETVYGLAANALDPGAVERIFAIKGRPAHNPVIVHVASLAMARACATHWPALADKLAKAFWPGPLTLVLPKSNALPAVVTAGGPTVGIRWPDHPVFQAVVQRCGFPLAAPSANVSGQVSPTAAEHVASSLGDRVPLIVDGGSCVIGIESTVLDLSVSPPRILRPGMIHAESLTAVVGPVRTAPFAGGRPRSPGLLLRHYSPRAPLRIWSGQDPSQLQDILRESGLPAERVHLLGRGQVPGGAAGNLCAMPREPAAYAKALYAELHRADQAGAGLIIVESVPDREEWRAIADRLKRAAAP